MTETNDSLGWRRGAPWPLLEREHESAVLGEALRDATEGRGRLVFLVGEAGIGKTAVLRLFAATHPSCRALTGVCEPLETSEALAPLFDIAPGLGPEVQECLVGGARRTVLFAAVATALRTASKTLLVVFEDVHWADQATLDLLRYLGRRVEGLPALIVATFREEEAGPGAPLSIVLGDLATAPGVARLSLAPLSEHATEVLAAGTSTDARELYKRTGGNPFFITEVLASGGNEVPKTVRDAVLARVARLAEPTRRAIEAAATIGPRVDPDLFASVLDAIGLPRWTMRAAIFTGFLRQDQSDLVFRHALAQSAIAGALPADRLQMLHRVILETLQETLPGPDSYAACVMHAEGAGDDDAVARFAPVAAARAATLSAHRESAALYGKALRPALRLPAEQRAELVELRAEQLTLSSELKLALSAYTAAAALWRELGNRLRLGRSLAQFAALCFLAGRHEEAEAAETEALCHLEELPPSRELAMAYVSRGLRLFRELEPSQAVYWSSRARVIAEEVGDVETALHARVCNSSARLLSGDEAAHVELTECLRLASEKEYEELIARISFHLGWLPLLQRNYIDVERHLGDGLVFAEEHELDYWRLLILATRARFCLEQGDWRRAEECAAGVVVARGAAPVARFPALVVGGRLKARRSAADAWLYLDEATELARTHPKLEELTGAYPARAEAAWLSGDWEAAQYEAESALAGGIGMNNPWWVGELACWRRRAGSNSDLPEIACRPARAAPIAEPYALELAGEFASAANWWETRGCRYEAALVSAFDDDAGAILKAVMTLDQLGATPAAAWARRRLRALGVTSIPRGPRPSTSANPGGLTAREQDVIELVAGGLTNGEIGRQLFLSPKTVERHLSSVLSKLGASSRSEAVGFARELGSLPPMQHEGIQPPI